MSNVYFHVFEYFLKWHFPLHQGFCSPNDAMNNADKYLNMVGL